MAGLDREKALDMALANIEKQYGKGSVMRLGDEVRPAMKVIPTGSIALDVALGVGGLPRGRVIEIYGPESSGKCLTADTYLWTDRGLETIAELFARCGQKASCTSRVTDIRDLGVRVVNERGELEPVAVLTHNNKRPVVRVTVSSGRTVSATHNHPLRVMNDRGFIVWRQAGELQVGDMLVSATFGAVEAAHGDGLSEDEAVLLGYLVAEGSLGYKDSIRFTNWDPEVASEYTSLATSLFGVTVRNYGDREHVIFNVELRRKLYSEYGMDYVNAPGKTIPARVRTSGHKAQRAFLSALFEGDGWIDQSSSVGLGTASEQLAREVQLLLYGLGIPSSVYTKFNQTYQRNYWSVIVNPAVAERFLNEIGFRSERRRKQVELNFRPAARDPQLENVPHVAALLRDLRDSSGIGSREFDRLAGDLFRSDLALGCSRRRLAKIVDFFDARSALLAPTGRAIVEYLRHLGSARQTYERITSVDDGGVQPTFDIVLPETHSFLANGVLSHNTTVALHAVASAQAAGGIAAFIDAEHALDPDYAKALGVDTDALLVSQPDTGEQALEITDMLVRSGALDIVVIDSVAALVPRAEIEGEMGDSHVGLQARLMSQALRKLTGALSNSGTTLIFINQLREKIGVLFGSPETTTGGKALKFYASVRLDVRRIETLKDGTDAVGNRTRIKVVKNKCLAEGSLVFDPTSGITHRIEDIVDNRIPVSVVAAAKDYTLHVRPVTNWFDQGEQDVIGLRLQGGTDLWVTPDHQILTDRGWQLTGNLDPGDRVARPRQMQGLGGWSHDGCLARDVIDPILGHLDRRGVTPHDAALMVGPLAGDPRGGMKQVLGASLLRRDRVQALADGLADEFLQGLLAEQVCYSAVREVLPGRRCRTFDLEVEELHTLVADGVVVHNCSPPFKQAEFDIIYGQGISREGSLIDVGVEQGFIRKAGAWYTYDGDQLGQGKENARSFLRDNPDLADEIEKKIKEKLGIGPVLDVDLPIDVAPVDF